MKKIVNTTWNRIKNVLVWYVINSFKIIMWMGVFTIVWVIILKLIN